MANVSLMPILGMNTVARDDNLQRGGDTPALFVRDAVNVDIHSDGRFSMRHGVRKVSDLALRNMWQSPLHGDVFAALGDEWGLVDTHNWGFQALARCGKGKIWHEVVNHHVMVATDEGILVYDGQLVKRLAIETPPMPLVLETVGSMEMGSYGVAVSWLSGKLESAVSAMATIEVKQGGLSVMLPMCTDDTVTGVRLYLTRCNGGELLQAGDYAIDAVKVDVVLLPRLGASARFRYLSPMPSGKFLKLWRGRLLVAHANRLLFSEAMAFHLHDERFGWLQFPQRITFVQPVEGGIWIGQVNHVVFLSGQDVANLTTMQTSGKPPVPESAILLGANEVGELSGGLPVAAWLAENGWVMGTANGQLVETQAGVMSAIMGQAGQSVLFERRVLTLCAM